MPCQFVGSFHRCNYKFDLIADGATVDLKSFCEKYYGGKVDEIMEYLRN